MAANFGLVTFAIDTTKTASQTQDVTGFGNGATTIKGYILFHIGQVTAADTVTGNAASPFVGVGFYDGTNQRCMGWADNDGNGTSSSSRANSNAAVIAAVNPGLETDVGTLAHGSFITDGIRFSYTSQFAAADGTHPGAMRVAVLAFWGDVTCEAGSVTLTAGTGNQTITFANSSLNPKAILLFHQIDNANGLIPSAVMGMGFADSAGNQGCLATSWQDAQANAVDKSYSYGSECLATLTGAGAVAHRWQIGAWAAGSVVINRLEGASADVLYYFALGGVSALVGNTTTETDTTSVRTLTLGHTPRAGIFFSHGNVQSTQDTAQAHAGLSIGAFSWDGTTLVQHAQACHGEDGNTTTNDVRSVEFDNVQITINATAASNDGTMRVKQVTTTSGGQVELDNNQNADAANNLVLYMLFGDQATAPSLWGGLRADTWNRLVQTV